MPSTRHATTVRAQGVRPRWLLVLFTALLLLVGGQVAVPPAAAQHIVPAADLSQFNAGNIISDEVFFAQNTMTESQIQSFLEARVPDCRSGYVCLKDWTDLSRTVSADQMCGAYAGGVRERASRIIYKVAQACGINPQVLLVILQKEQGLVTHVWPSEFRFRIAMGMACPDTAACDSRFYGFFNQVYGAAWQMKRYANPKGTTNFFTWYAPGKTWNVLYHPQNSCGRAAVAVANQATANLYYYTPYQPNAAALRAGYGTGDSCSSYGNRNFYNYFTDWFGSTQRLPSQVDRISGSDRFDTAVAVSNQTYPEHADTVYLASGLAFPDALSVAPRAAREEAALLLVLPNSLPASVATELKRLKPSSVILVGGTAAIDAEMTHRVRAVVGAGVQVSRIGGANRYETSRQLASATPTTTVYLVTGVAFPDALGAGAAAGRAGAPVILVDGFRSSLDEATASLLRTLGVKSAVIVGGTTAVPAGISTQLGTMGITVTRHGGADRYATNALLNDADFGAAVARIVLATGTNFPDALSGSVLAARSSGPLFVTSGSCLTAGSADYIARHRGTPVSLIGGPAALGDQVEKLRRC